MTPVYKKQGKDHLLYDSELIKQVEASFFDSEFWRQRGAVVGEACGRGTTLFVKNESEVYALRHYCRGGLIANWIKDQYIWLGCFRTRPWREWHLLKWMFDAGLPVPRPLAARVRRQFWSYSADLMTLLLPDCRSLANVLGTTALSDSLWEGIGATVRDFHDQGIDHADLNAHNILLNKTGKVFLIDFDRGCRRLGSEAWKHRNLSRLHRSLIKVTAKGSHAPFSDGEWKSFLKGYHA